MSIPDINAILSASVEARPALLEGRWFGRAACQAILAVGPVSTLEGEASAISELPSWLDWHTDRYPEGVAIGFLTYELARIFEKAPLSPDPDLPEFSFAYYPRIEPIDGFGFSSLGPAERTRAAILKGFDRPQFVTDIERIHEYIAAGDIYQANLTQPFVARLNGQTPESVYARLSPGQAPMRAFLRTPHATIISDSPERFFRVHGRHILTSPIKGTLPRAGNAHEDRTRRTTLLASVKDRAENVMIVDLLRNDLGRICHYETIRARLWEIEELPHLFHLVSHVDGELRPEAGPIEILRALFPCGSITGAPKIRAMEILSELEPSPRGVSMGAIGIIHGAPGTAQFEMDFSVAIRTISVRGDVATFNVGCGIVYDSEPDAEFDEMQLKAQPLLESLGLQTQAELRRPEVLAARR